MLREHLCLALPQSGKYRRHCRYLLRHQGPIVRMVGDGDLGRGVEQWRRLEGPVHHADSGRWSISEHPRRLHLRGDVQTSTPSIQLPHPLELLDLP